MSEAQIFNLVYIMVQREENFYPSLYSAHYSKQWLLTALNTWENVPLILNQRSPYLQLTTIYEACQYAENDWQLNGHLKTGDLYNHICGWNSIIEEEIQLWPYT